MSEELTRKWEHYCTGGAICSEMEASTIFVLSSIHRKRAGAANVMMAKDAHLPKDSEEMALFKGDRAIAVAVEAIKRLIEQDRKQEERASKHKRGVDEPCSTESRVAEAQGAEPAYPVRGTPDAKGSAKRART